MLNICILNATVIFNSVPTNKHISNLDFRIKFVDGLLCCRRSTVSNLPVQLIQKMHCPGKNTSGRKRDCIVCSNRQLRNRKQTRMICIQCTCPMCIVPCFENYHTLHLAYIYGKTMDPSWEITCQGPSDCMISKLSLVTYMYFHYITYMYFHYYCHVCKKSSHSYRSVVFR